MPIKSKVKRIQKSWYVTNFGYFELIFVKMHVQIVQTQDGSKSIYLPELNEHYHSIHGAKTESEHIYIQHGLLPKLNSNTLIRVLEVGMGTGLNVICTYRASLEQNNKIEYHTLEPMPLPKNIIKTLNYPDLWPKETLKPIFEAIHEQPFNIPIELNKNMQLIKYKEGIQTFQSEQLFDVVYFDAFAPEKQPEMWVSTVFEHILKLMMPNAVLVTYCCKGDVKRSLKQVGFKVEKDCGPPGGKREMLIASKV